MNNNVDTCFVCTHILFFDDNFSYIIHFDNKEPVEVNIEIINLSVRVILTD